MWTDSELASICWLISSSQSVLAVHWLWSPVMEERLHAIVSLQAEAAHMIAPSQLLTWQPYFELLDIASIVSDTRLSRSILEIVFVLVERWSTTFDKYGDHAFGCRRTSKTSLHDAITKTLTIRLVPSTSRLCSLQDSNQVAIKFGGLWWYHSRQSSDYH